MDQTLSLRYAALSDVGRVRKDNQDSGFAGPHLLMVADGVGGAARGDVASSTAVQILRRLDAPAPEDTHEALAGAIHRAHDRIAELVEEDPELDGTSTTVTAALFDGHKLSVAHVGDSRGYLLRDGVLSQLTKDHTFVQSLIDEGRLTEEESRTHPHRNLILRAVDGVHDTDPDLFDVELAAGDRILLCSDGASGVLEPDRLTDILSTGSVDYAVVELIRAALEAGSSDNITCVVADVVADDAAAAEDPEAAAATTGPMLVGAAAEQPRRGGAGGMAKSLFRGHRSGDTGELEPVPGDEEDIDPEELRYAPRPPRRFRWARRIALLVVVLVVLAVAATFAYRWSQRQYYVAAVGNKVAVYRGVEATVPGLTMHAPVTTSPITLQSLDEYTAEQVRDGIAAKSRQDAADIVERLRTVATACPTPEPTPTTSPKKSPKPSGKATGGSTARPTAKAVATATPSAQASGSPAPSSTQSASPSPAPSPTPSPAPSPTLTPPNCITKAPQ